MLNPSASLRMYFWIYIGCGTTHTPGLWGGPMWDNGEECPTTEVREMGDNNSHAELRPRARRN